MGARRTLCRVFSLPREERRNYLLAWWTLLECRLRLRCRRILRGRRLVMRALDGRENNGDNQSETRLIETFELAVADHLYRPNCLPRALALWRYLERNGCAARVEMGMTRDSLGLMGHIWLARRGRVVGSSEEHAATFRRLMRGDERHEVSFRAKGAAGTA
jgi:hypothetical protein